MKRSINYKMNYIEWRGRRKPINGYIFVKEKLDEESPLYLPPIGEVDTYTVVAAEDERVVGATVLVKTNNVISWKDILIIKAEDLIGVKNA